MMNPEIPEALRERLRRLAAHVGNRIAERWLRNQAVDAAEQSATAEGDQSRTRSDGESSERIGGEK